MVPGVDQRQQAGDNKDRGDQREHQQSPGLVHILAVVDQLPTHEFVISLAPSRFVTVPAALILQLLNEVPQVAAIVNARLAQRLREALVQRTLLTMSSPLQRVCAQLIQLTIKTPDGDQVIALAPTHQEIAIMINVTRETVTRVFQKLQTHGVIIRNGNALEIKNLQYLSHVASGEQEE